MIDDKKVESTKEVSDKAPVAESKAEASSTEAAK